METGPTPIYLSGGKAKLVMAQDAQGKPVEMVQLTLIQPLPNGFPGPQALFLLDPKTALGLAAVLEDAVTRRPGGTPPPH